MFSENKNRENSQTKHPLLILLGLMCWAVSLSFAFFSSSCSSSLRAFSYFLLIFQFLFPFFAFLTNSINLVWLPVSSSLHFFLFRQIPIHYFVFQLGFQTPKVSLFSFLVHFFPRLWFSAPDVCLNVFTFFIANRYFVSFSNSALCVCSNVY